ncbi:MAG TPA: nitrilase-related carbon-nitrogen hydrolase, partial [Polyangiaceae bacterium]
MLLGALGALGQPGIDLSPCYFAAEVALAYLVLGERRLGRVAIIGIFWGLGLFSVISLGTLSWGARVPVSLTLIGVALYSLPLALWASAAARFGRVLAFAATVAAWSLWLDFGDWLGFPLKQSAFSLVVTAPQLAGGVRLVGANVFSAILTATALGVAQSLASDRGRASETRAIGALPALAAGFSSVALLALLAHVTAGPSGRALRVGVPQIDTGSTYYSARLLRPELVTAFDQGVARLLDELDDVELIAMTEAFDGRFSLTLPGLRKTWEDRARARAQPLLLSSFTVEERGWKGNAVAGIDARGRITGVHRKVDLALEGEKMLAAGTDYEVFRLAPDLVVGVPICLESALRNAPHAMTRLGANLLVVSTSDVTFGSNVTGFEHLATTQLRALEVGRAVVWASNGGPSGVIDRWGAFEPAAPFRERAAARMSAALESDTTFYLRYSSAVSLVAALALLGAGALARRTAPVVVAPASLLGASWFEARRRTSVLGLLAACGALALACLSPALVEASRGRVARAGAAVIETFASPKTYVPPDA